MTLPIVWIPGHLCGPCLYAPQLGAFGGAYETIIADTFGDDDLGAMAERLIAGAPERFIVAGLSMGCMVAMEVLARAPERVAGAVLLDTDPTRARKLKVVMSFFRVGQAASILCHALFWAVAWPASRAMNHAI